VPVSGLGAVVLIGLLVPAAASHADVSLVSQDRYVFESVGELNLVEHAVGFGPFSHAFTITSQTSDIGTEIMTGSGSAGPDDFFSFNSSTSYFKVVFDVVSPQEFAFTGGLTTGIFDGSGVVHFAGPSGDIVNIFSSGDESFTWNESGTLATGQYSLEVFVSNQVGSGLSTFDFTLTVPGPAGLVAMLLGLPVTMRGRRR
jgi:hypothetical protein